MIISTPFQADTGKWYVTVSYRGVRQEFKFDHEPTEADLALVQAELMRQHFSIDDAILTREIEPDGTG